MKLVSLQKAWSRRGLRARIFLLMGVGTLAPLLALGGASWVSFGHVQGRLLAERRLLAESIAAHVDYALSSNLEILQGVSSKLGASFEDLDPGEGQAAVKEAYLHSRFFERVFLVDVHGEVLSQEPLGGQDAEVAWARLAFVKETIQTGRPIVSELVADSSGAKRLYALVPLRNWQGKVRGLVAGEINPARRRFSLLLQPIPLGEGGTVDLVGKNSVIIASTDPKRSYSRSDHREFPEEVIQESQSATASSPSIDQSGPLRGQVAEVIAFAPLLQVPWEIVVRQPEAQAFSTMIALLRRILWFEPMLLAITLLFAWGVARSVTRPLAILTRASEQIAAGELAKPISSPGVDEIGRLGRSLERMRVALKESLETVAQANQELERRVDERTRELEHLYRQLQEREESRGLLLRKVISAQEEERKRIARELHDATSQALTAMAVSLEMVLSTLPSGEPRKRLEEAERLAMQTVDELHRLILDLRPSVLDDLGLLSAIRWCADRHLQPLGIAVRCEFSEMDRRLPPQMETAVFRAVQEAVTNIAKHAQAETVLIQCAAQKGMLTVEIEDDGKGFDPSRMGKPADTTGGFGLLGIRERMELLGGTAQIESSPSQGCRILLTVPLVFEGNHA